MATMTPGAWLERLEPRLNDRWMRPRTGMGVFDAYYEGDHRLAFATAQFREAFGALFGAIADNWMQLVVQATRERLTVQGFRYGKDNAAADRAWEIWQANGLDAESKMVHTEAIKLGEAYWLVAPPKRGSDDPPTVTCEHPSQVIVECDPANRRKRLAALKKWMGADGYAYAIVYTPEWIAHYRTQKKLREYSGRRLDWQPDNGASGRNPLGVVPVVPIRNDPSMLGGGVSDIAVAIPIQDALNKLLSDMLVGAEYQAFPQRVLLGVEIPKDPETGQPIRAAQLQASRSRLWMFADENAKAFEFNAADLNNYVNARQHLTRGLTAKTRTPPHYVLGEIINASGDALTAAETGLTSKTEDKQPAMAEGHEEMESLSFLAMGDTERAKITDSEVVWKDVEKKTFAQRVDGAVKMRSGLNLPEEMCWEALGLSPQEIGRAKALNAVEDLLGTPEPPPLPPDVPQNGTTPPVPPEPAPV
jgi:hypothetical protein